MNGRKDTAVKAILEQLIEHGPDDIAGVFARAFELAMQLERERFLGASHYERSSGRQGYANGYKPKRIDTPAGTVSLAIRKRIGAELREVWNAANLAKAEEALTSLATHYHNAAPILAAWLEKNVPEGLAVFALPEHHRRRLRTSNPIERAVQQELKRRTVKVRVFPNEDSLERLVSAILVEIDNKWAADTKAYIKWEFPDA